MRIFLYGKLRINYGGGFSFGSWKNNAGKPRENMQVKLIRAKTSARVFYIKINSKSLFATFQAVCVTWISLSLPYQVYSITAGYNEWRTPERIPTRDYHIYKPLNEPLDDLRHARTFGQDTAKDRLEKTIFEVIFYLFSLMNSFLLLVLVKNFQGPFRGIIHFVKKKTQNTLNVHLELNNFLKFHKIPFTFRCPSILQFKILKPN